MTQSGHGKSTLLRSGVNRYDRASSLDLSVVNEASTVPRSDWHSGNRLAARCTGTDDPQDAHHRFSWSAYAIRHEFMDRRICAPAERARLDRGRKSHD